MRIICRAFNGKTTPSWVINFLTAKQIADFDVERVADDGDVGYILEVDLSYPFHLHNIHSDYPLAPEATFPSLID